MFFFSPQVICLFQPSIVSSSVTPYRESLHHLKASLVLAEQRKISHLGNSYFSKTKDYCFGNPRWLVRVGLPVTSVEIAKGLICLLDQSKEENTCWVINSGFISWLSLWIVMPWLHQLTLTKEQPLKHKTYNQVWLTIELYWLSTQYVDKQYVECMHAHLQCRGLWCSSYVFFWESTGLWNYHLLIRRREAEVLPFQRWF